MLLLQAMVRDMQWLLLLLLLLLPKYQFTPSGHIDELYASTPWSPCSKLCIIKQNTVTFALITNVAS
jgi:hypothetical protein